MFYEFFVGLSKSISTIGLEVRMLIWIDLGIELLWALSSAFPHVLNQPKFMGSAS